MKCMCVGGLSALGLQPLGFQDRKSPGFPGDSKESGSSFVYLVDLHVGLLSWAWAMVLMKVAGD